MTRATFSSAAIAALAALVVVASCVPGHVGEATYAFLKTRASAQNNVFKANATFASCDTPGPDNFGYTCNITSSRFEDISGNGTHVSFGNSNVSQSIKLGFSFDFYGEKKTSLKVSANGFLNFETNDDGCCKGQFLPNSTNPNGIIAGYWEHLDPKSSGNVTYATLGASGSHRFIVQFTNVPHASGGNLTTFEMTLYEGNSTVVLSYRSVTSDGGTHVAGIENKFGNDGLRARYDSFTLTGRSVIFTHPDG